MNRIKIELWLWTKLKVDFETPSEMRAVHQEEVEEGKTIREFLDHLSEHYPAIALKVFDRQAKILYPHLVLNYNDHVINPHIVHDLVLRDGDKITILPMYPGG
jgi:molybdopterin converting factor small subunit